MVKRTFIIFSVTTWLLLPITGFAVSSPLQLSVTSNQGEYGKPILVDLWARNELPDLKSLDLSPLDQDFVVEMPDNIEHDTTTGQQHWRIHLYPRRLGELLIPSLYFQDGKTDPVKVIVDPAVESKDSPISVSSNIGETRVWLNQAVPVTVQVETDRQFARLDSETHRLDGADIVVLPYTRDKRLQDGKQIMQHRIQWLIYPQATGIISIQLPAVNYERNGLVTHRFYPPRLELQVKALPAFVPPTMPVGQITLDVSLPDVLFLIKDELTFLTLRIASESPPEQQPFSVLRQLISNSTVTVYPHRDLAADGNGMANQNERRYQVPFTPNIMGIIRLPAIRLQYFDPSIGKIVTKTQSLGQVVAISPWVLYLLLVVVLLVAYRLVKFVYSWGRSRYKVYDAYFTALCAFQQADTPQAIKSGLMEIAHGEGWPSNLTLAVWLNHWMKRYPRLSSVADSVLRLQSAIYGNTEAPLKEIREQLMDVCYRRLPLLKIQKLNKSSRS